MLMTEHKYRSRATIARSLESFCRASASAGLGERSRKLLLLHPTERPIRPGVLASTPN